MPPRDQLDAAIDHLLAQALQGRDASWPSAWQTAEHLQTAITRAQYHGICGLLTEQVALISAWPEAILAPIKRQAVAQAMWEIRHKLVLTSLLAELSSHGINALILKGTGIAYDLYSNPSSRARGDTDLLVERQQLVIARRVLATAGFERDPRTDTACDEISLQEMWHLYAQDGTKHTIDLHWQIMNSPSLRDMLSQDECRPSARQLPRLSDNAMTLDRVRMLIHTSLHRASHNTAPYFSNGNAYHGSDRLIWASDIDLLAKGLSAKEWTLLANEVLKHGVASVCLDGLLYAQQVLATPIPTDMIAELQRGSNSQAAAYLLESRPLRKSWQDLMAQPGWHKRLHYALTRIFPSANFIRSKYQNKASYPLLVLYTLRILKLLGSRYGRKRS